MTDTTVRPKGGRYFVVGLWHKVGDHGFVYFWNGHDWRKSTKLKSELI